ncbi:ABC transporter permease [Aeromicrobium sp. CTD01-1L150]|uniref:ABC transporter permease n=1 Tax=Aeromicrobium sp. CTD01-1L150 TaxID=3341830 RepID=UPI0035C06B66
MTSPTAVLAVRNTVRIARNPSALVGGLITPVVLMLAIWSVFGRAMEANGLDYGHYLVPGITLQAIIFAAAGSAGAIGTDRTSGVLDRQRTLPISAAAPILGRLVADLVRSVLSVVTATVVGFTLGFRLKGAASELLAYALLVVAFAVAVSLLFDAVALAASSPAAAISLVQAATIPLVLLSTSYAPSTLLPDWAARIIEHLPVSAVGEALRQASDGALTTPVLIEAAAWAFAIGASGLLLGARAFRRTA